jgi:hypothetical protein
VCVGACVARFDGERFHKRAVDYRVGRLSAAWERTRIADNDLSFHRAGAGSISATATCEGYDDVPEAALLNHLLFGTTQRTYLVEEDVTLDGRGARHAVVDAELDGVPVRIEVYVVVRGGCVFDLSYVSGRDASARADFAHFVAGFQISRVGRE